MEKVCAYSEEDVLYEEELSEGTGNLLGSFFLGNIRELRHHFCGILKASLSRYFIFV